MKATTLPAVLLLVVSIQGPSAAQWCYPTGLSLSINDCRVKKPYQPDVLCCYGPTSCCYHNPDGSPRCESLPPNYCAQRSGLVQGIGSGTAVWNGQGTYTAWARTGWARWEYDEDQATWVYYFSLEYTTWEQHWLQPGQQWTYQHSRNSWDLPGTGMDYTLFATAFTGWQSPWDLLHKSCTIKH